MFDWTDTNSGWDGRTTSGSLAPEGVYYYIITAKGANGKDYAFHGFLTLLRK
jgi:flagellar hook assembly protein FlgD